MRGSSDVDIGDRSAVLARLTAGAPLKFGKERRAFYVVAFPQGAAMATAFASYPADMRPALDLGVLALSTRSSHRGVGVA